MSEREGSLAIEGLQVPGEIIESIRTQLVTELDSTLESVQLRAPEARAAFESQWATGTKKATYSLEWGDPLNTNLPIFAATVRQWMEKDYGDGMIDISVRGRGRPGDMTDELVAENKYSVLQARTEAGAVFVSESALRTALRHIREGKEQAIDDQEWESAARWRDYEKNVLRALGGVGLARPDN
jgi:hypothetical protein